MREWLSGGAPPCQGGGRGFDPRLALFLFITEMLYFKAFPFLFVWKSWIKSKLHFCDVQDIYLHIIIL